ncbi:MAG: HAD family phosphatase [Erysipelotrichaceae bacterium]
MKITGVIFDFNGTLVYDSKLHVIAWRKFSSEIAKQELTIEQMQNQVFGVHNAVAIKNLFKMKLTNTQIENYSKDKEAYYRQIALEQPSYQLVDGAYDVFQYLKDKNYPFTIASASIKENIDFFVEHFKLDEWINPQHIVYDNGTYPNKVQMFKDAADLLEVAIEDTLIFEDSLSGVNDAIKAGCKQIIVIHEESYRAYFQTLPEVIYHAQHFHDVLAFLKQYL